MRHILSISSALRPFHFRRDRDRVPFMRLVPIFAQICLNENRMRAHLSGSDLVSRGRSVRRNVKVV